MDHLSLEAWQDFLYGANGQPEFAASEQRLRSVGRSIKRQAMTDHEMTRR